MLGRKIISFFRLIRRRELINELLVRGRTRKKRKLNCKWEMFQSRGKGCIYKLDGGLRIRLYANDRLSELIFKGSFELDELVFVRDFLRSDDVFVDIGSNIGVFTITAANAVSDGRVYAFEPTQETFNRLMDNIELNRLKNVFCFQIALSDQEEMRTLIVSRDGYAAWNSLAQPTAGEEFDQEQVRCSTWDDFAAENELVGNTTLMKIDVEGWELHVLNGAVKVLSRSDAPDILIEFTDENMKAAGSTCSAVYSLLEDFGYTLYLIDTENRVLRFSRLRDYYPYLNLLATKRISFVANRLGYSIQPQ